MNDPIGASKPGNHLEHFLGTCRADITQHNLIFLADQTQELFFIERCHCDGGQFTAEIRYKRTQLKYLQIFELRMLMQRHHLSCLVTVWMCLQRFFVNFLNRDAVAQLISNLQHSQWAANLL